MCDAEASQSGRKGASAAGHQEQGVGTEVLPQPRSAAAQKVLSPGLARALQSPDVLGLGGPQKEAPGLVRT